jgi:protein-S-isoprenylcysteine O-methyltransferase Ste14
MTNQKAKRWVEVVEFIVYTIGVSVLLNVSAGFTAYWQAGVLALVCFACLLPMLFYFVEHPALFKRRISFGPGAEHETSQKIIVSFLLLLYAALYVVSGLDHRFGWSHVPVVLGGDLVFAGGLVLIFLVFEANPFAVATVVIIWRLVDEERYLSNHLAGYRDFCANVTHRLLPSIW